MQDKASNLARIQSAFTSRKWQWCFYEQGELPKDLISALKFGLPHIDADSWHSRLAWGGIYVNGEVANENRALPLPCKLEYYEPTFPLDQADRIYPKFSAAQILYRDEILLIAYKPNGIPSMPAREQPHYNFKAQLESFLDAKIHLPARLDMSASGLLMASLEAKYHAAINRLYESRSIKKFYRIEVTPKVTWTDLKIDAAIDKDPLHPVLRKVVDSGGKSAQTDFSLLQQRANSSLLEARPRSGRTHQIRVHAKHCGHALIGDKFYGGEDAPELRLACVQLSFKHPASAREMDFVLPPNLMPTWALA